MLRHSRHDPIQTDPAEPRGRTGATNTRQIRRTRVRLRRLFRTFGPVMPQPEWREAFRAGIGAGLALALCGAFLVLLATWQGTVSVFILIAPLGATAFLLFAVPNSPLAQPWSAVTGNTVSALVAVAVTGLGLAPELAAGVAVCLAMGAMAGLRAMHPPGAAVALAMVLSTPDGGTLGLGFVASPVLLDTVLLVGLAVLYNRATGRKYPFRQPIVASRHATSNYDPERRLGLSGEDLAGLLDRYNLSANIGAEDFGRILAAAEAEAAHRHFDGLTCAEVMSRDVVTVTPATRLGRVADLFREHRFKTLPVVEPDSTLCGIITQNDLIQRARGDAALRHDGFASALLGMLDSVRGGLVARDVMTTDLRTVAPADGIGALVHLLADGGVQAAPVVTAARLDGIATRSDLLAVLARRTVLAGLTPTRDLS
ncbi:MAG: HPP family protein [Roseovarius sp.]|nr:HPP family protein [Roseovarius sp.]